MAAKTVTISAKLVDARRTMNEAKRNLERAIKLAFPVGSEVLYKRIYKGPEVTATVDMHGYQGDFRILTDKTQKHVWIRGGMADNCRRVE